MIDFKAKLYNKCLSPVCIDCKQPIYRSELEEVEVIVNKSIIWIHKKCIKERRTK